MRPFVTLIALCIGCMTAANAQTFTQRLQQSKAGEGKVTVTHSQTIDKLVNGQAQAVHKDSVKKTEITVAEAKALLRQMNSRDTTISRRATASHDTIGTAAPVVDTSKKIMRGGQKVMGYRVQVFAAATSARTVRRPSALAARSRRCFPISPSMFTSTPPAGSAAWVTSVLTRKPSRC